MAEHVSEHVTVARADGVMTVTLARPDKKNALTRDMYRAVTAALAEADGDLEIGAVVLAGAGGAFTAGNDLADFMAAGGPSPNGEGPQAAMALLHRLVALEAPLLAAVEGVAIGIGTTLLLHCDAAVAHPEARFKTPFIDLALCPEGGSSLLMPARLGRAATMRFLMLGEEVPAEDARAWGLVDAIDTDPLARAQTLAAALAAKPRAALRATKRLIRAAEGSRVRETIDREAALFAERLGSSEAQAAFRAFFQRAASR